MKKFNRRYLLENEIEYSKEERGAFLESLHEFSNLKNAIYRPTDLKQISEKLGQFIQAAEAFTLQETRDDFDKISVNRDLKEIQNDYKTFEKTASELRMLQQRLENCYENIGTKLTKYYRL